MKKIKIIATIIIAYFAFFYILASSGTGIVGYPSFNIISNATIGKVAHFLLPFGPFSLQGFLIFYIVQHIILAYMIGSIPFGYILTKSAGNGDIRTIGSGNIGATNVLRTGSKKLAILTLLGDLLKGWVVVYYCSKIMHLQGIFLNLIMFTVLIGHLFPVWLNFKGGKGVATYAGILLGFSPALGFIALGIWSLMLAIFRYSSLAALVSTALVPIMACFLLDMPAVLFQYSIGTLTLMSSIIWWRHKDNIQRLIKGEEPKVGHK